MTATTSLEDRVDAATDRFVAELAQLTTEPYLKDAISKMVTRDLSWALLEKLDLDEYTLAEDLEIMADVLREHAREQAARRAQKVAEEAIANHVATAPLPSEPDLFAGSPAGAA